MANVKEIMKNAVVLFLITAVVAALLAGANLLTKDRIAQNAADAEQAALVEVLEVAGQPVQTDALSAIDFAEPVTGAYIAKDGDTVVGYCIKVEPKGYGGSMQVIFGVNTDLTITGMRVLSHSETAGLGANVEKDTFQSQFIGKSEIAGVAKTNAKEKEILALSGATISSKAVTRAAQTALEAASYLAQKEAVQ